ncbi:glycosyltransferase [Lysobacter sp. F6437]|uniref:glycosyltransferase n=1 Tax=Lysobacter sp. F6437 TaxID=3459296 RepID=UPI00403E0312
MARILVLASRLPFPPREGHQLRTWHLIDALARRHEVTLLGFLREDDDPSAAGPLRRRLHDLHLFPIPAAQSRVALARALLRGTLGRRPFLAEKYSSAAFRTKLRELAAHVDLVHFDMLPLMAHVDCVPPGIPVVLNAHNVEHQLLAARAEIEPGRAAGAFLSGQLAKLRAFEAAACARADQVLACSDTDADALRALATDTPMEVIANGVDIDANRPATSLAGGRQLVFVGQMGWFPNRDGVDWFLRDVFPRILQVRPDVEFVLVGKTAGLEVPAPMRPHVRLAGFVPDLRPLVHEAAVYVVPLRAGSGTRLKVLEAMALGKAIVTTTIGSEGIALRDGESAVFADGPQAFADAVLALLDAPARAARLGRAARMLAEQDYGWSAIGQRLLDCYDRLLPAPDDDARPLRQALNR